MNQSRLQSKVGLFVAVCLVLVVILLIAFSKGTPWFTSTYEIKMRIDNAGGLQQNSAVFLAGIQVGTLKSIELAPDGRSVLLHLQIRKKYRIHSDAEFRVEQIGVLGDQFVSIYPQDNKGPLLRDGAIVEGHQSFSLQQVAQSANGLITELSATLAEIREGLTNIKSGVLKPETLSNFSLTIGNFRKVSEHTLALMQNVKQIVQTNSEPFTQSVSNMLGFSSRLKEVAQHLDETIQTNRSGVGAAVTNFRDVTVSLKGVASDLNAGKGLAGSLLKDEHIKVEVSQVVSNLVVLSSNLNRYGLLYKPRKPIEPILGTNLYPGKSPF